MMHSQTHNPARQLAEHGTLIYRDQQVPLDAGEWQQLQKLLEHAHYDHVIGGDSNERHSVHVARFVNDVEAPCDLSPLSPQIRSIVMSDKMLDFYSRFVGSRELCLRRCQANRLQHGDYIGVHKDQDSNPDYKATVVFHFDGDYEGGDFVTHHDSGTESFHPGPGSMLVNNCEIPHEVTPVRSGTRHTLACFLSMEFGESPGRREAFRLSD